MINKIDTNSLFIPAILHFFRCLAISSNVNGCYLYFPCFIIFQCLIIVYIVAALNSDQPPSLPPLDGSKRITSLIKKCCHARPTDRPEMKQITRKLQSILASGDAPDDKCTEASALLGSNRESKADARS